MLRLDELGDTIGEQWQPLDLEVSQEKDMQSATKFFVNGKQKTKRIHLSSGMVMECTNNHQYRIFTSNGYEWVRADEIQLMDKIAIRIGGYTNQSNHKFVEAPSDLRHIRKPRAITMPQYMHEDLAFLLGLMTGNGSIHTKNIRIHYNHNAMDKVQRAAKLLEDIFGIKPIIMKERTTLTVYVNSMALLRWLQANKLVKKSSLTASIPFAIRSSSTQCMEAFIAGLYETDGSHTNNTKYIDTSSYQMAQELLVCLRAIGQNARIATYTDIVGRISKNPSYRIYFRKFASTGIHADNASLRFVKRDSRATLLATREYGDELAWDEVVDIEDSEAETFDIEVPGTNTYLANNVVSHNTTSAIAGSFCSGIEPAFANAFMREQAGGQMIEFNPYLDRAMRERGFWYDGFHADVHKAHGSVANMTHLPEDMRAVFVTAHDIAPLDHVEMQAVIQENGVDLATSKTINFGESATMEEIADAVVYAHSRGIKGLSIYRDNSRAGQTYSTGDDPRKERIDAVLSHAAGEGFTTTLGRDRETYTITLRDATAGKAKFTCTEEGTHHYITEGGCIRCVNHGISACPTL
jgi:hypothetical protein